MAQFKTSIIIDAKDAGASRVVDSLRNKFGTLGASVKAADDAGGFNRTTTGLQGVSRQLSQLRAAFIAYQAIQGAVAGIRSVFETADAYTNLSARLKLVTADQTEFNATYAGLRDLANRTLAPLEQAAQAFVRLQPAVKNLGGSYRETLALTEAVTSSLRISGATAQEQASALLQFAQGLGSNFQGDEFRALTETAPRLMQAVADGMGRNVTELKAMSAAGKLTADVVSNALIKNLQKLKAEAATLPVTVGGAFTILQNATLEYVGSVDSATGVSRAFAGVIVGLAKNFKLIADSAVILATALAAIGFGRLVAAIQASIVATVAQAAANRAGAIAAVEAAAAETSQAAATVAETRATIASAQQKLAAAQAARIHAQFLVANAEAAIANATGLQRLSLVTTQLIPAQQRLAASTAAVTGAFAGLAAAQGRLTAAQAAGATAQTGLTVAQGAAAVAGSRVALVLRSLLGLFGGPIGLIATLVIAGASFLTFSRESSSAMDSLNERLEKSRDLMRKVREDQAALSRGEAPKPAEDPAVAELLKQREQLVAANRPAFTRSGTFRETGKGVNDEEIAALDATIAKTREKSAELDRNTKAAERNAEAIRLLNKPPASTEEATNGLQTRTNILREFEQQSKVIDESFAAAIKKASDAGDQNRVRALERERTEARTAAIKERESALKGLAGAAGSTAAAQSRLPALKDEFDAAFKLTKDALERESALLTQNLEDNLVSIRDYFAEREHIGQASFDNETGRIQAERKQQEDHIAALRKSQGSGDANREAQINDQISASLERIKKLDAELIVLGRQRATESEANTRAESAATKSLANDIAALKQEVLELTGAATPADRKKALERQFADLRKQLVANRDQFPEGEATLDRNIDLKVKIGQFTDVERQFNDALTRMRSAEEGFAIERDAGLITESQLREKVLDKHRETAAVVEALVPRLQELGASISPEFANRAAAATNEFKRMLVVVDEVAVAINGAIRDSFENMFSDLASGAKNFKDAMRDLFRSIEQSISKIASQQLADKLFGGKGSGGAGGIITDFLGLGKSTSSAGTPGSDSFVGPLQPSAGGGGVFDSIFKFFGSFFHKGGVVGRDGDQRPVSPFVFHTAKRLHEGGVPDAAAAAPGLKPNEVPAVLLREEEVLTRKDPRHRANIASAAKAGTLPELISKIASAFHGGGIAGVPTGTLRTIDPLALVSAQRFHTGGVAGFDQDELGRILDQSQSPKETLMREVQRKENRGRSQVNVTIVANDIGSFRRSQGQVQETIASAVDRGRRNQ